MTQVEKTLLVFKADDGKEFVSKEDCEKYENEVLVIKKNIKYFSSICHPDLTEGRGYYGKIYFAVHENGYCHFQRCLQYMFENFGRTIDYVQGCSPMPNWYVPSEIKEADYKNKSKQKVGDYYHEATQVFISEIEVEGYPKPIWIK